MHSALGEEWHGHTSVAGDQHFNATGMHCLSLVPAAPQ